MSLTRAKPDSLIGELLGKGAALRIGAVSVDLRVDSRSTAEEVADLYADYPREADGSLCDHNIAISGTWLRHRNYRRGLFTRQVSAEIDGDRPFLAFPQDHALPIIESAMNWAVAMEDLHCLILHAATVERDGRALLIPGHSGSGKSTLCAALVSQGWRLLSDEFALVNLEDSRLFPHPRPISLKNDSVALIAERNGNAHFSRVYPETFKGRVAYMRAPENAILRADEPAMASLILFPKFEAGSPLHLERLAKAGSFERLMEHASNYHRLMRRGFETLANLVEQCRHYELRYGSLDEALACIDDLVGQSGTTDPLA